MQLGQKRQRCRLDECEWCTRDDLPCGGCSGTGWWNPEMPHQEGNGAIVWIRVEEPCRICAATGREHGVPEVIEDSQEDTQTPLRRAS
ncbi:hypothetical protein J4H86_17030 [Spiractinospora alimapuensis]|nr:hypothetical protein [Spiractinospora alimapuensis]QVQ54974.1 hypothetical protein J4H86_17030 [Spiractinospora alimapuensis]